MPRVVDLASRQVSVKPTLVVRNRRGRPLRVIIKRIPIDLTDDEAEQLGRLVLMMVENRRDEQ